MDESESPWTEITIQPDGRVYIFGMSKAVLEVMSGLPAQEPTLNRLLEHIHQQEASTLAQQLGEPS